MKKRISYKTFSDLQTTRHCKTSGMFQARLDFENGYGVSVVAGPYCTMNAAFELAVMKDGKICYDTHITQDVEPCHNEGDVTRLMALIQELQPGHEGPQVKKPSLKIV